MQCFNPTQPLNPLPFCLRKIVDSARLGPNHQTGLPVPLSQLAKALAGWLSEWCPLYRSWEKVFINLIWFFHILYMIEGHLKTYSHSNYDWKKEFSCSRMGLPYYAKHVYWEPWDQQISLFPLQSPCNKNNMKMTKQRIKTIRTWHKDNKNNENETQQRKTEKTGHNKEKTISKWANRWITTWFQ